MTEKNENYFDELRENFGTEKWFINAENREKVENVSRKKAKIEVKCEFCPQGFRSKNLLLSHQNLCHFVYKCPLCDETIRGITNAQSHVANVHGISVPESRLGFHFWKYLFVIKK